MNSGCIEQARFEQVGLYSSGVKFSKYIAVGGDRGAVVFDAEYTPVNSHDRSVQATDVSGRELRPSASVEKQLRENDRLGEEKPRLSRKRLVGKKIPPNLRDSGCARGYTCGYLPSNGVGTANGSTQMDIGLNNGKFDG